MIGNRVVVTGLAALTPIGNDLDTSWKNLVAGKSGISLLDRFDTTPFATKIAGQVKDFDHSMFVPEKLGKRMDNFTNWAMSCSKMLLEDAQWEISEEEEPYVGSTLGCGLGGLQIIENATLKLDARGPKKVSPFTIPALIGNMAPGMIAILNKVRGPNMIISSACASATHAIGSAYSDIKLGRQHAMITGGTESVLTKLAFASFNALKALSTRNDEPEKASRPFDKDRDGFIMGEGCGLLLLESLEHAKARGAKIYAELVGYGASADAFHMTAPDEEGKGMALAMEMAIREAGVAPEEIDHINAHATSTYLNDRTETRALKSVFGKHAYDLAISANKSMIGHLLGGAGGVEGVFSVMALREGVIPGTINLENPDDECDLDYVADGSRQQQAEFAMSNSFGFGGTNASLLFRRYND